MSPLVSLLFRTFLNRLKLLMEVSNIRTSHTTYVRMQYRLTSANFFAYKGLKVQDDAMLDSTYVHTYNMHQTSASFSVNNQYSYLNITNFD